MARTYNVIDADGHILEPFTLWNEYLDPAFRDRAPRLIKDNTGKQRLLLEEKLLGSRAGFGGIGGVGARQGVVAAESMDYEDGRKGGFDPHARIPDMDLDGIDAAFLYPSLGLFIGSITDAAFAGAMCRAYNRWLADYCKPYPDRLFGIAMLPKGASPRYVRSGSNWMDRRSGSPMAPSVDGKPRRLITERFPPISSSSSPFSSSTNRSARSRNGGSR